jgi:signal transduction histidine kinase
MTDIGDERFRELEAKLRILEDENNALAEQVEETLLLSLISETLNSFNDFKSILDTALERISVLKNIPLCSCCEIKEYQAIPVNTFLQFRDENSLVKSFQLSEQVLRQVFDGHRLFELSGDPEINGGLSISVEHLDFHWVLLIPFQNQFISQGLFVFADTDTTNRIGTYESVLNRMVHLIMERIEKIILLHEVQELNINLEKRVMERTLELSQSNRKLRKEITERKRIEKELVTARDRAEESDRLKSAFLANMSHEIRTPMNSILGFSSLLQDSTPSPEQQQKYIQIIRSSGDFLLKLIDDILDLSRIESNQLAFSFENFHPAQLLRELFELFSRDERLLRKKAVSLRFSIGIPDEFTMHSDPVRIRQILINLLGNALKFTESGTIEFGCKAVRHTPDEQPSLIFFVKDTGIGIHASDHPNVFKRFWKAEEKLIQIHRGAGLGLPISKQLVEKMGGKIWFESSPGIGSTFFFSLPCDDFGLTYDNSFRPAIDEENEKNTSWNGTKILVVDDDAFSLIYLRELLVPFGLMILEASHGSAALSLILEHPDIRLVLLDIKLPDEDGYSVRQKINNQNPLLPVIAQTAFAMKEERDRILQSGFTAYLSKPVDRSRLIELLKQYL